MFNREWRFYLDGLNQPKFVMSGLNYDATLRNLELIGEAATHIPDTIRQENPHIPWRLIIATRNRLIHGYLGIDNDTLWSIIQTDIPSLLPQLYQLRKTVCQSNDT
ncbi:MAG: DUF86 domain-containing protein [Proteobacteria bacterium]|nr:DUF86 domain-containing protein [Desulfobulbaceae bacterium]MBU4153868.1 DUF86 domain-containing protein [Pseudomonadota bacterium]MDP2106246.1 DUF86 domain-containing protein [Desulfobulbaceae bacterium]